MEKVFQAISSVGNFVSIHEHKKLCVEFGQAVEEKVNYSKIWHPLTYQHKILQPVASAPIINIAAIYYIHGFMLK